MREVQKVKKLIGIEAIKKAIEISGSQVALAKKLGCTYQAIQAWRAKGEVPPARAVQIEKATDGVVTRYELRPDLF